MLKYHIQTIEVPSGGSSAITFSNIPQNFDDLLFVFSTREGTTNTGSYVVGSFNGITTGYTYRELNGAGSGSATSGSYTTGAAAQIMSYSQAGASTSNTFANSQLYISNYTSSAHKSYSVDGVMENNATVSVQTIGAGIWANTSAITSAVFIAYFASNWQAGSSASLYGIKRGADGVTNGAASGGTVTTSGGFTYHTFTSSGTFTVNRNLQVEALVVAGGGGGAGAYGAPGAGGLLGLSTLVAAGSYSVTVGAGGAGTNSQFGNNGSNSIFLSANAVGGGRGASDANGQPGGSGGGAGGPASSFPNVGQPVAGQGNAGGLGAGTSGFQAGGGGGGAGGAGSNAPGVQSAGNGGIGSNAYSVWAAATGTGESGRYAGGGGGAAYGNSGTSVAGSGGLGGGGRGRAQVAGSILQEPTAGMANTGGGGGSGMNSTAPNGGSGIVIIRYPTPA